MSVLITAFIGGLIIHYVMEALDDRSIRRELDRRYKEQA